MTNQIELYEHEPYRSNPNLLKKGSKSLVAMAIMVAVAVLCFPIFLSGNVIRRHEAALFLIYYGIYTGFLIAAANNPDLKERFGSVVLYGVLPLTAFALFISLGKHLLGRNSRDASLTTATSHAVPPVDYEPSNSGPKSESTNPE